MYAAQEFFESLLNTESVKETCVWMNGVTGFFSTGVYKGPSVGACLGFNATVFRKLRHGY